MLICNLKGRVLPAELRLTLNHGAWYNWSDAALGLHGKIAVTLQSGIVEANCETAGFDSRSDAHFFRLYSQAFEVIGLTINLVTFATGINTTLVLDTFTYPDGRTEWIYFADDKLAQHCSAFTLQAESMAKIIEFAVRVPQFHNALRDLNESLLPRRSNINCARALETIRHLISPNSERDRRPAAWEALRNALNVSREYIQPIMDQSLAGRHGSYEEIDSAISKERTRRSWIIMNRFLEFKLRGDQPLKEPDFPLLN